MVWDKLPTVLLLGRWVVTTLQCILGSMFNSVDGYVSAVT